MEVNKGKCGELEMDFAALTIDDTAGKRYNLRPRKTKCMNIRKQPKIEQKRKQKMKKHTIGKNKIKCELWSRVSKTKDEKYKQTKQQKAKTYPTCRENQKDITDSLRTSSIKTEPNLGDLRFKPIDESQNNPIDSPDSKPSQNGLLVRISRYTQSNDSIDTAKLKQASNRIQDKNSKKGQTNTHNPPQELYLSPCLREKEVKSEQDLFYILDTCRIVGKTGCGFIMVKYNWTNQHLRLVPGLNILANCKNFDCTQHLEGVICPRGLFPEREGYCPLDGELFNAICPSCKTNIAPDDSFGFGFYNCDFQLTYKLHKQPKFITELKKKEGRFYFGKYKPLNDTLDILQVRMSV